MRKGQIVLVLLGVLALAAGGTALAAKGRGGGHTVRGVADHRGPHGLGGDLEAAASYLGISVDSLFAQLRGGKTLSEVADSTSGKSTAGLVAALVAHEKEELADAVKAGRLSQAQADTIAATLTERLDAFVRHSGMGPRFGRAPHHGGLETAASYLGIAESALLEQLRSGKTLAQIANATTGKSASGLVDALVADATKRFGTAAPPDLRARITQLVNGQLPAIGPRGRHDHWLPGRRA